MSTILAYTSPAAGHLFPLVPGLTELRDRGHDVVVLTDPELVGTMREQGLRAEPVAAEVCAIPATDYLATGAKERLARGVRDIVGRGRHEIGDLRRAIEEHDPDALLVDMNAYGAAVAGEASGLPWAIAMPTLLPLPGAGIPPFGLGLKPMHNPLGRLRDRVLTRMVTRLFSDAMLPEINAMRASAGLPPIDDITEHMLRGDRLLVLTGDPLEYDRVDLPAQVRFCGAQLFDPPQATPAWLDEPGDPWVLVTCSTEYQGDERLAAAAIEALRDEPVRVVVTLADASRRAADLPYAENARVERFVPHGAVLDRALAVISHGGMGIVQKTIAAGVPLVVVPFGRDQPEVARRVTEAGAGVTLPLKRLDGGRLNDAFQKARALRPGVEAASARLRAGGGGMRVADAMESLTGQREVVAV